MFDVFVAGFLFLVTGDLKSMKNLFSIKKSVENTKFGYFYKLFNYFPFQNLKNQQTDVTDIP